MVAGAALVSGLPGCAAKTNETQLTARTAAPDGPADEDNDLEETGRRVGEIATQPARDLGVTGKKIPEVLLAARKDPYNSHGMTKCTNIAAAIEELNAVLGPDFEENLSQGENRVGKVAEAAGKTVVNSILPFRSLVRELTGAAPAQRRRAAAVEAGFARRGYLRALQNTRNCPVQASPAVEARAAETPSGKR